MTHPQLLRLIFWFASLLVPSNRRHEWLMEWRSELWYALRSHPRGRLETLGFVLGAFHDAFWIWRHSISGWLERRRRSPLSCVACLATLAAGCLASFVFTERGDNIFALGPNRRIAFWMMFQILCALLIMPAVMNTSVGRTFEAEQSPALKGRGRRGLFAFAKFALVLVIAFFGALEFTPPTLQPQATLVGCILGFRWLLLDNRMRCPICLRRLVRITGVGSASHTLLDRYGTKLCCEQGHGFLCEPVVITNYTAQHWSDSV